MKTAIWQGFDHEWSHTGHRVNRFGNFVVDGAPSPDGDVRGTFTSLMTVGRVADECTTSVRVQGLDAPGCVFHTGEVTRELSGRLGRKVEWEGDPIELHIRGANLTGTVILTGFDIECKSFEAGYHTRGFGVRVKDIEVEKRESSTTIRFRPWFMMFPEHSPDPLTRAAPDVWRYEMTAKYAIVHAEEGDLEVKRERREKLYEGPSPEPEPVATSMTGIGGGAFPSAVVALRGFEWTLRPWEPTAFDGRYLRQLKITLANFDYRPRTGRMDFNVRQFFTNKSLVPYKFKVAHALYISLLQFKSSEPIYEASRETHVVTSRRKSSDFRLNRGG